MTNEELEKLRQISIKTILGKRNDGRTITIVCPIHKERTPSMVIYPGNDFYCYGCRANGQNSIDFMVALGATFQEAISELQKYL